MEKTVAIKKEIQLTDSLLNLYPTDIEIEVESTDIPFNAQDVEVKVEPKDVSQKGQVTLQVYTAKEHGSKNYTRIDYCFYCEKAVKSRISRHYARKHSERSAVQEALKLLGHQRQRAFAKIQNRGNFKHNMKVLKDGYGELVPVKRSIQGTDAFQMLPCSYCFGFYTSRFLKSHMATCSFSTKRARTTFPSTLNQTSLRTKLSKMSVKETQSLKCSSRLCDPKSNSVTLQVYTAKEHGSKNYTRIDYCFYCEKAVKSRISRHYAGKHSEMTAVQKALKLVGNERHRAFAKIQNQGNFKHNMKVLNNGDGELVPVKRPIRQTDAGQMLPCNYCFGFYTSRFLKYHMATCSFRSKDTTTSFPSTLNRISLRTKPSKMPRIERKFTESFSRLCDTKSTSGIKRKWTQDEKDKFAEIYANDTLSTKEKIRELKQAFPYRSEAVIRARCSNVKLNKVS
ncbi:uncharacterized protein [Watersipora subatra]|uniref:uncharacterized protein n=1 Tax=Watersipora subatra TaxID=2589382 RepID=UPI00355B9023